MIIWTGLPDAGTTVWDIAAAAAIIATIAMTVRSFMNAASISVSPPLALEASVRSGPNRAVTACQQAANAEEPAAPDDVRGPGL